MGTLPAFRIKIDAHDDITRSLDRRVRHRKDVAQGNCERRSPPYFSLRNWMPVAGVADRAIFAKLFMNRSILNDYVQQSRNQSTLLRSGAHIGYLCDDGAMSAVPESLAAIAVPAPSLPVDRIAGEVERQFGLRGEYSPLVSERDQNFRLVSGDDESFVVKVVSSADSVTTTEYQIEVLRLLGDQGRVWCSAHSPNGRRQHSRRDRMWIRATISCYASSAGLMARVAAMMRLMKSLPRVLGQKIAELDNALEDFRHPR